MQSPFHPYKVEVHLLQVDYSHPPRQRKQQHKAKQDGEFGEEVALAGGHD